MPLCIHNGVTVNTFLVLTPEHAKPKSNWTKLLTLSSYRAVQLYIQLKYGLFSIMFICFACVLFHFKISVVVDMKHIVIRGK